MIADSSFLVALFLDGDVNHATALSMSLENAKEDIIIIDRVLEETFTVLAYKEGVGFALECAKKIISNQRTVLYRLEGDEEARIFELAGKISKKLSYVDYSIIYLARKHNHRVLTFDRQLSALVG